MADVSSRQDPYHQLRLVTDILEIERPPVHIRHRAPRRQAVEETPMVRMQCRFDAVRKTSGSKSSEAGEENLSETNLPPKKPTSQKVSGYSGRAASDRMRSEISHVSLPGHQDGQLSSLAATATSRPVVLTECTSHDILLSSLPDKGGTDETGHRP